MQWRVKTVYGNDWAGLEFGSEWDRIAVLLGQISSRPEPCRGRIQAGQSHAEAGAEQGQGQEEIKDTPSGAVRGWRSSIRSGPVMFRCMPDCVRYRAEPPSAD